MEPKSIAAIGAGGRGKLFARIIGQMPHLAKVVAVAEPMDGHRAKFSEEFGVSSSLQFRNWEEFVEQPRLCDAVVIATMDRDHAGPAVACLDKGYDVLLEKPMAVTLEDCQAIEQAQRRNGGVVGVCHSLRYNKGFCKVKELVDAGAIGRIVTIDLLEQISFELYAHGYVRGNWKNESSSTFMLMAKSCHDIDYLCYLIGKPCVRVSSFGGLAYFTRENAPSGSTDRCTDPCPLESTCTYSAIKQYVTPDPTDWFAGAISLDHSREARLQVLRTGPYGRCAWKCDNDVTDHQVVNLQFTEGITATFTATAFTQHGGRRLRVHGTTAELAFDEDSITIRTFGDENVQRIDLGAEPGGHGGGDTRVMRQWLAALHSRDVSAVVANAQESLSSHRVVFAAEESRRQGRTIELDRF